MEIINVIGWYGTETIGDRGILGGLIRVFSHRYSDFVIRLGSLYPFYSNRCIYEDLDFYRVLSDNKLREITTYDVTNIGELRHTIRQSDILCFGGGPLMDVPAMFNMEYAFSYAKRQHVKTAILGCGIGPLSQKNIIQSVMHLINLADVVILRDALSLDTYRSLGGTKKLVVSVDPACFCALAYYEHNIPANRRGNQCAMNFRDVSHDQYASAYLGKYKDYFRELIANCVDSTSYSIVLTPMHSFYHGGDDRYFLNSLAVDFPKERVQVMNNPLSLQQTLALFFDSDVCYGMRFHSVLFQTVLNGNNYIIDYTNPNNGKTIGLLKQLGLQDDYKSAYCSLVNNDFNLLTNEPHVNPTISHDYIRKCFDTYISLL